MLGARQHGSGPHLPEPTDIKMKFWQHFKSGRFIGADLRSFQLAAAVILRPTHFPQSLSCFLDAVLRTSKIAYLRPSGISILISKLRHPADSCSACATHIQEFTKKGYRDKRGTRTAQGVLRSALTYAFKRTASRTVLLLPLPARA